MFSLIPAFVALSAALSASAHPLRSGNVFSRHHAVDIALRADGDRYADPEGWFTGYLVRFGCRLTSSLTLSSLLILIGRLHDIPPAVSCH
jgi:hypothetical protein